MREQAQKSQRSQAVPVKQKVAAHEPAKENRIIAIPSEPSAMKTAAKETFLGDLAATVLQTQASNLIIDETGAATRAYLDAIKESIQPRDAIEEMIACQMAWTHSRIGRLTVLSASQTQLPAMQIILEACDRASNTFRRQMLALAEYRRPPRTEAFVAIRQANVANQQIVQNGKLGKIENEKQSNEQGSSPTVLPQQLRPEVVAEVGAKESTVAVQHRPKD